jgi:hypothetical protein
MAVSHLVVPQGTDVVIRVPNVRGVDGVLVTNFTGCSVRGQARVRIDSPEPAAEWSTDAGTVTFDGSDALLIIDHDMSSAWTWTEALYDVELTDAASKRARIAEGKITVSQEVTR